MKFPWHKYEELPVSRRNTLQIFITNRCNLKCQGCFARKVMKDQVDISMKEYERAISKFVCEGGEQINLLGGEPLLHPELLKMLALNRKYQLKTTIYTNGYFLHNFKSFELALTKIRISFYGPTTNKDLRFIENSDIRFDANFMVSRVTTVEDLLQTAFEAEKCFKCKVFFISSLRELDNPRQEFFDDTDLTMPVLQYKELVHKFLARYDGNMEIHVSKRGVFESTLPGVVDNKCHFANYIIGGKIIQCPYDLVNEKYQKDYTFGTRYCQHNSTCLMAKVVYKRKSHEL